MISTTELILRLVLSAVIGGFIGMEREANNRPAGLRTHVLVTVGSALIMLLSMYGFTHLTAADRGDPARLAAQVVSGIGFLGAGTILRTENKVSGLTTAASLWVCGGIGLAIGNGFYLGGLVTAVVVLFTLRSLGVLEKKFFKKKYRVLIIQFYERPGLIGDIGQIMGNNSILIKDIRMVSEEELESEDEDEGPGMITEAYFAVKLPAKYVGKKFFSELMAVSGMISAQWEGGKKRFPAKPSEPIEKEDL
ncbi:MgtC/SapB family protein [Anoxynatronum buryatiense]|uniref:Mg2+ transporter-C (MgtC) family protein n=1 Tax=Anoxynatronum buryatiense TaxID=489973 RepID=A0AA45WZB0_9CLOT|nr:MgtC/SapB family protein [Anoxynatronum buryatiense]SMP67323.1 putative Mg2+ transporter-C (MgtC) family protein [Anoxynatronum buryatiense]